MPPLPTDLFAPRQLVTEATELLTYEMDAGLDHGMPDAVFYPEAPDDVVKLVQWAATRGVPLIARGAGTGLAGGAVAEIGGIVVVSSRMDSIQEPDSAARTLVVESGAVNLEVETLARKAGLYYPPDPASGRSCAIGGNLGTNAGGPHCFKYGVTTNYVAALELVLADGTAVRLGGAALDYPEYDLRALVVGAEGTLGIVTRATLRLRSAPPAVKTLTVSFGTLEEAGDAVSAVIASGLTPATLEAIDQNGMQVIEDHCHPGLPVHAGAMLIVDVDGYAQSLDSQISEIVAVLERHGGRDTHIAQTEAERERIWYGRKSAAGAMARMAPTYYLTDVTVRRSRLAAVLGRIREICARHGLRTATFFHAGDGNLHPLIPGDPKEPGWLDRVHQAMREIIDLCVAEDGSITGEHGVGMEKRGDMLRMYGGAELAAMRDVKNAFDPDGLFNPRKVLPSGLPAATRVTAVEVQDTTVAPVSAESTAGILRGLSQSGRSARIGAAIDGDRDRADVWLSTSRLRGIQTFAPQDLFITVGAGTSMSKVHDFLGPRGLHLPIASPWAEASAGGLAASNLNSPQRMLYGGIRDLTLCARVALADGRVVRIGRPLVKNVAGYDLPKVFIGSHGTLGVLVDLTFRLTPAPRARRTLRVPVEDLQHGLALAREALDGSLVASAVALEPDGEDGWALLYTAEGLAEEVDLESELFEAGLRRAGSRPAADSPLSGTERWASFLASAEPAKEQDLLVRAAVPLGSLQDYLGEVSSSLGCRVLVDYPSAIVWIVDRPAGPQEAISWLQDLRRPALERGGYAVAMSVPRALRAGLDPWGYRPEGIEVMQRLKDRWDPRRVLNPGGFVVG